MVGEDGRNHETLLTQSTGSIPGPEERLNNTLLAIEAAINSRPIVQAEEGSGALTPAHFLIEERLTAIPTGPEPVMNGV